MPAYNAADFISEAIESVIDQEYRNWELIVVDDGSTDSTSALIQSYGDSRIRYIYQHNQGVSSARNKALEVMGGDFFCFLDSDDCFPMGALQAQVDYMISHPECTLLGGQVRVMNTNLTETLSTFQPTYFGNPLSEYVRLKNTCFYSITGFVRHKPFQHYNFNPKVTHGEDLLFYIHLAANSEVCFHSIEGETYIYRRSPDSTMSNLQGLSKGYETLYRYIRDNNYSNGKDLCMLKFKVFRIMSFSCLKKGQYLEAVKSIKLLFL
jgi:glycosyltransferase involved in cell wall biosynthesis